MTKLNKPAPQRHPVKGQFQDDRKSVDTVEFGQQAINNVANEVMAMSEMELFKAWLMVRKGVVLGQISVTTGQEQAMHRSALSMFSDVAHVVSVFEREARG